MAVKILTPNEPEPVKLERGIILGYLALFIDAWVIFPSKIIPGPLEIIRVFPELWNGGLGVELFTSLELYLQAVAITTLVSLVIAYGAALPLLRPLAGWVSVARFNSMVGLSLLLTLLIGNPHWIKVALLVIGMSVFTVPAVLSSIRAIPSDEYDHARTLRMREWRVLWEVVILGRFHEALEILRTNFSMGWMLLPLVEGLFRNEGGIGVMLVTSNKYFRLDAIYCLVIFICLVGMFQDFLIVRLKHMLCPYAYLGVERNT